MIFREIFYKKKREWLYSILTSDDVVNEIRSNLKKLTMLIPPIKDMIGFNHNHPHHNLDVWEHTLCALSVSNNAFEVRLALLLHDIGKPHSFQYDGKVNHYKGHNRVSCKIAKNTLTRLGFDNDLIETVSNLVLLHDTPIHKSDILKKPDFFNMLFEIQKCDTLAHNPEFNEKRYAYLEYVKTLFG